MDANKSRRKLVNTIEDTLLNNKCRLKNFFIDVHVMVLSHTTVSRICKTEFKNVIMKSLAIIIIINLIFEPNL